MVNRLSKVHDRFRILLQIVGGPNFYGQLLEIPDTSRVSNFLSARRYLRTAVNTIVKPRDVIIANSLKYIVAEHGDGFFNEPIYKHFKLFEVDQVIEHFAVAKIRDPITGVYETVRDTNPTQIYLSTQPSSLINDSLNIPTAQKTCITNHEVNVGDKIGNYLVTKSDLVLGVTLIQMKDV